VEEHNGEPVIVMELLEGESAKGIIHRDIKPANIFIVGDRRVKILDFGIAKVIRAPEAERQTGEESLTLKGAIVGTTSYMSPSRYGEKRLTGAAICFHWAVCSTSWPQGSSRLIEKT
jgi:serine/threonine protein kinase